MNTSVNPCEDFAEYVCGGWQAENNWEISKYRSRDALSAISTKNKHIFINAITTESPLWDESSIAAAKMFYDSCYWSQLSEEDLQTEDLLKEFIKMVNFSDYTLNNVSLNINSTEIYDIEWDAESAAGFQEAMAWTLIHEWDDLFKLYPVSTSGIAIEQNAEKWISYNRSEWEDRMFETFIPLYQSLFGLTEEQALFIAELVLDFTDEVAAITTVDYTYLDATLKLRHTRSTVGNELNQVLGGQIGLLDYEQLVIDMFECTDISCISTIIYYEPGIQFFRNLSIMINQTSPYIVQYWFFTDILDNYFNYGHNEESFAQSRLIDRRDYCYDQTKQSFPHVYAYILSLKEYSQEKHELALEITQRILSDGVAALMEEVDWLDTYSLNNSLKKAENMDLYIGIPPNISSNIDLINEYYDEISMNLNLSNGFIKNYDLLLEFAAKNELKIISGESINLHDPWPLYFAIPEWYYKWLTGVNALYVSEKIEVFDDMKGNFFCMPESITQTPVFNLDYPMLVNYASWGTVVGHEITHGFDSSGSQYDFEGNLVEMWTNETRALYNERIQCFIEQYDKIEVEPSIFVNGTQTNTENTADNGGMAATRVAYKQWKMDNDIEIDSKQTILPGLEFTEEQLWWISYARTWCGVSQPGYYENWKGVHAPLPARINGVVSNFEQFANAFECPAKAPMNPESKCGLWHN